MQIASISQCDFAAQQLKSGAVIACPTESVWGLACDPFNEEAVDRLLELKGRPVEKGLILLSGSASHFDGLLNPLNSEQRAFVEVITERPTTWLVPDPNNVIPSWVKGQHLAVAIRVTKHPSIMRLTESLGSAIISTSANPSGLPTASDADELEQYFGESLDYILPGTVAKGARSSKICDLISGDIIRP